MCFTKEATIKETFILKYGSLYTLTFTRYYSVSEHFKLKYLDDAGKMGRHDASLEPQRQGIERRFESNSGRHDRRSSPFERRVPWSHT